MEKPRASGGTGTVRRHGGAFDPREFGAAGDGKTMDTAAIQRTIEACAAASGGEVVFGGGTFLTGMFFLRDNVTLRLEADGRILGSPHEADYPTDIPLRHLDAGKTPRLRTTALIVADECRNTGIAGTGTIDCNGDAFVELSTQVSGYGHEENWTNREPLGDNWTNWKYRRKKGILSPPRMVLFAGCSDVRVEDVTMVNPAAGWGYWVVNCDRVAFNRCRILADPQYPNNDGIHINSSRDVVVTGCTIVAGDDAIIVRCNNRPLRSGARPVCERITVSGCRLRSHANCIRLGWLNDGTIRDCTFTDLTMSDSAAGIGIDLPAFEKGMSDYGDEATVIEDIRFAGISMERIYSAPVRIDVSSDAFTRMGAIRRLSFDRLVCSATKFPHFAIGKPEHRLEEIVFTDCAFEKRPASSFPANWKQVGAAFWYNTVEEVFRGVPGVRYENCTFRCDPQ